MCLLVRPKMTEEDKRLLKLSDLLSLDRDTKRYRQAVIWEMVGLLRLRGIKMDSPYDLENFIQDHCSHSQLFEAGAFSCEPDELD